MEPQTSPSSQSYLIKMNKSGGIIPLDFKIYPKDPKVYNWHKNIHISQWKRMERSGLLFYNNCAKNTQLGDNNV
jgi:hypothetical protein